MRFGLAAAALAAMVLATPAAAQNDAVDVVRGAMERLVANAGEAQDYTLALRSGTLRTEVYVYLDGSGWEVAVPDDDPLGDMLGALVLWPRLHSRGADILQAGELSPDQAARIGRALGLTRETVDGRPLHVLVVRPGELMDEPDSEMPDSLRMFVDPDSRQILRVQVAGDASAMAGDMASGGSMRGSMDFSDYRETDGVTVPRAMRLVIDMDLEITDGQRAGMQAAMAAARAEMAQDDSLEGREEAALMDVVMGLVTEGHMDVSVTVETVRVNAGPPAWFQD
ncbi:MAG TPA: hypothetical protein VE871_16705 [Longimicrobium sp.]|nr:hypothetical protein [Longimicrobium sp.]